SPLSACFAHSRGSTACAFAIAGETCSKSCTARHLAASIGLPQTSSYSAATIRRTVSTTMSRARSSLTQGIRCAGKARDERHEKLVAQPVHHEIVEVNGIFGHRTGKAVRKARDIPNLPVLETGGNQGGLVYADISALVRLLVRSARQALLTTLYRSTDCLCRSGAAMKNLAQSASLHAGENI